MKELEKEQIIIRQYLLGDLDEEARQQVEQRVMTERDYKEEVLMSEEELLEEFAAGALKGHERELFLNNYLSAPLQKRKLRFVQAINKYAANRPPLTAVKVPETSWFRRYFDAFRARKWFVQLSWALLVVIVIGSSWVAFQTWPWRSQQAELRQELERLNSQQSNVFEASSSVLSATLVPLSLREGSKAVPLTIRHETQIVQFRLAVPPGQHQRYRATLKNSKLDEVLSLDDLPVRTLGNARLIVIQVPARVFKTDDYVLTLSGLNSVGAYEEEGDYSFRVVREE
jgi:hypothetical protein